MFVRQGMAQSIALAERYRLGRFVILHGVQRYRADRRPERSVSGSGGSEPKAWQGWGDEVQSWHGATAEASAPGWCCACKRGRACPDPGKHPRVIKGVQEHGHLDAMDGREICALIGQLRPRPINLGIVPAAGIMVLDIDPRNGGPDTLRSLEARYGALPETLGVYTGGGGEHRWWQVERSTGNRVATIGPGLDIKTSGGLLVAPPSVHVRTGHRGRGLRYQWANTQRPPTRAPDWLETITRVQETASGGAGKATDTGRAQPGVIAQEMARAQVGELSLTFYRLACWVLETDDDIDELRMAARAAGLNERKIASQLAGAQRKVRGTRR